MHAGGGALVFDENAGHVRQKLVQAPGEILEASRSPRGLSVSSNVRPPPEISKPWLPA